MKIILSRKGFDSSAGGKPSIIYNNQFYSIPIPEAGSGVFYKDLIFDEKHNYLEVMRDLGVTFFSEAHLDPDLRKDILPQRHPEWRPIFGQDDKSQSRLSKTFNVEPSDIFLFFGNFQKVIKKSETGFKYSSLSPEYPKDIHVIFGHLQVDEIIDLSKQGERIQDWMKYHPHIKNSNLYHKEHNALYVSKRRFTENETINGSGYFRFSEELILTAPKATKSVWHLPSCFDEKDLKKFGINTTKNVPEKSNKRYIIQPIGRGTQEVFGIDKKSIVDWAIDLITKHGANNDD